MYSNPSLRNNTYPYVFQPISEKQYTPICTPTISEKQNTPICTQPIPETFSQHAFKQRHCWSDWWCLFPILSREQRFLFLQLSPPSSQWSDVLGSAPAGQFISQAPQHFRSSKTQGTCGCSAHFLGHIPQTLACPGQYIHRIYDKRQPPYTLEPLLTALERSSKHCAVSLGRRRQCNKPNCIFVLLLLAYNFTHKGLFDSPSFGVGSVWA